VKVRHAAAGLGLMVSLGLAACGEQGPALSEPARRGRSTYVANCTACHAMDPTRTGSLGPDIAGSSRELIEARVMRAQYPPGYSPKRASVAMVALPHLAAHIDDIYAYLSEVAP
jgi:mono/diheme cytochrome c family protein